MDDPAAPWRSLEAPVAVPESDAGGPDQRRLLAIAALTAALVLGIVAFVVASADGGGTIEGPAPLASGDVASGGLAPRASPGSTNELVVEIVGAIARPGVYRLPTASRIGDLVTAAGGYGPRVDADHAALELNLAALLQDGQQVHVPSRDDPPSGGSAGGPGGSAETSSGGSSAGPVHLNTATEAELDALPGIGPVTAGKIIAGRQEQPFASVDDLRTRKLVGQATFDKIRALVAVP
jgi:competence protein ComEA